METRVFRITKALQNKDAEHAKSMAKVLESAASYYKSLEGEHSKNLNTMKEAKEKARVEATKRAQLEEEMAQMKEKVRKLETECIQAIGKAREEGKEEVMGEVKAQLQLVHNSGFRDGWKFSLKKIEISTESEHFLRANTPLPYPNVGLKDTNDEANDEDDYEEEDGEELGGPNNQPRGSHPELTDRTADAPEINPSS